ncbi:MAG: hypothetical protein DHS80DRAFT_22219 [Piptocephalis tieghemiana]|nr:MAG: hypothetical protein DHS80DRAFT_22219 [Piptocephalis tieghemiana]
MHLLNLLAATLVPLAATTILAMPVPGKHHQVSEVKGHVHASSSRLVGQDTGIMYHFHVDGIRQGKDGEISTGPVGVVATSSSGETIANPPEQPKVSVGTSSFSSDEGLTFRANFDEASRYRTTVVIENAGGIEQGSLSATYGRRLLDPNAQQPKDVQYSLVVSNVHVEGNVVTSTPEYVLSVKDAQGRVLPEALETVMIRLSVNRATGKPRVTMRFDDTTPERTYEPAGMSEDIGELDQGTIKITAWRALRSAHQEQIFSAVS